MDRGRVPRDVIMSPDRARSKGVVHRNTAARYVSRLTHAVRKAEASALAFQPVPAMLGKA